MSYQRPLNLPHFKAILIWWHCPFKVVFLSFKRLIRKILVNSLGQLQDGARI
jgi:hypothetical protein